MHRRAARTGDVIQSAEFVGPITNFDFHAVNGLLDAYLAVA